MLPLSPTKRDPDSKTLLLALSTVFKVRGGIPRFNQMLCLALDELSQTLGLRVKVLSIHDSMPDYLEHGSPWKHVEFVPCGSYSGTVRRVLRECLRERVDVFLVGLIGMTPLGLLARPFLTHGFGFIAHGEEVWTRVRPSRLIPARAARYAFSVSEYTAQEMCRHNSIDPARVRILPNTVAPEFEKMPAEGRPGDAGLEILSVSRLWIEDRRKGVDVTLRVLSRLAKRFPSLRYRVVGKGAGKQQLVALASSLGLDGHVLFEQDLDDSQLAERYRQCSVFVLPSGQEGFGIVFLEAMRFAKPCVGGSPGGAPEIVEDGTTGFIVPFGNEHSLEAALERLLADADLRRRMGEAGRKRLEERFLYSRFKERLEALLRAWFSEA